MKLNAEQKRAYAAVFGEGSILEYLRQKFNSDWEVIYDPMPNDGEYALIIDGLEYDRLDVIFVRELIRME